MHCIVCVDHLCEYPPGVKLLNHRGGIGIFGVPNEVVEARRPVRVNIDGTDLGDVLQRRSKCGGRYVLLTGTLRARYPWTSASSAVWLAWSEESHTQ